METNKNHNNNGGGGGGGGGNALQGNNHDHNQAAGGGAGRRSSTGRILLKLEEDIKAAIFNVMYIMLKDSDITFWKMAILLIFDFFQMVQFTFSKCMESAWKGESFFYYVSTFLSFTHIVPWMEGLGLISYLVIFYLCILMISITIVCMVYVHYSSARLKTALIWPQQLLRLGCFTLPTILYIPFLGFQAQGVHISVLTWFFSLIEHLLALELFTSMLVCVSSKDSSSTTLQLQQNNSQVHKIYQDFQCWTGIHIIHATFAIIASIIIITLSFIITLTYYKTLQTATDAAAKSDSRPDVQRLIQKTITIYAYSFLFNDDQQWFLISVAVVLSSFTFERYYFLKCYYNEGIQRLHSCLRALCLWSNSVLLLAKVLQNTEFNGSLQLWLMGFPLMFALVFLSRDDRKGEMLMSVSSFQQGEDAARQIRYYLHVLQKRDGGDRNSEILLKGYIYNHEETCPNAACQLKQYKRNIIIFTQNKQRKGKGVNMIVSQKMDNNLLLIQHARNMFRQAILKFPNCATLRIFYAFFLIEKQNRKTEALQELALALQSAPTFDEQFIIYRHKKLSEEFSEESSAMNGMAAGGQNGQTDKQQSQNAVDLMTRFAFESTFRQLQVQIEKCAHFHLEFWNYLKDDRPDLGKLGDCGTRINNSIIQVDQIWNELQKLNSNAPKAMKLYGRYLIEILHDKESGSEQLQRAKDVANMKQNYVIGSFDEVSNIMQISSDGTPCVIVSGEPDRMSLITQCNSGAVRVFGFQQYELKNQKVEKLMPELYARHHAKILEEALQKGAENIINKERLIFAKHKSGYIFPVWIQLKLIQNMQNEIQFIALFKIDKKMMNANIGYILFNKEKKIHGISSSCIKMMGLDINMIRRMVAANYDLSRLSPDLEDQREELMTTKTGLVIEWVIPFFQRKRWAKVSEHKDKLSNLKKNAPESLHPGEKGQEPVKKEQTQITKRRFKFLCTLSPITMGSMNEIGHFIRLDHAKSDSARYFNQQKIQSQIPKQVPSKGREVVRQPLFQFRFEFFSGRFIREIRDPDVPFSNKNPYFTEEEFLKQSTDGSSGQTNRKSNPRKSLLELGAEQSTLATERVLIDMPGGKHDTTPDSTQAAALLISGMAAPLIAPDHVQEDLFLRKKKWGKGISIYTLREGRVQLKDYVDEEKRLMELEEQKRKRQEEEERNMQELANFQNNIKSKKALRTSLNDASVPPAIQNLRITMNVVIAFLLALAISEFTVISQQFQEINENFGMIQRSYLRVSEVQRVAYDIRTLILINEGKLTNYPSYTVSNVNYLDFLKSDLEYALNSLYELQDYISLSQLQLSSPHQNMVTNKVVQLYFKESTTGLKVINFTLTESVLQMSSAIFTVRHLANNLFTEDQEDISFVIYNSFNCFLRAMLLSSGYFESELYDRSSQKTNLLLILFICSLGIVCLSIPILLPAVNSVNKTKDRVLSLFTEIPNSYLYELALRCEVFLNTCHDQQQDEMKSQEDRSTQGGIEFGGSGLDSGMSKRSIVKQPRNSSNTSRNFFFQYSIAVLLVIAYFTSMFIIARTYINNIEILTKEMSVAAFNEAHFAFIQNTQREMIYNPNRTILSANSFDVSRDYLRKIYDQVQLYMELHQENRNVHNSDYLDMFKTIMNTNLCDSSYIQQSLLPVACPTLFNDGPTHGLQTVVIMYFELLRETLNTYQNLTLIIQGQHLQLSNTTSTNTSGGTSGSNSTTGGGSNSTATNNSSSSSSGTGKNNSTSSSSTKKNTTTSTATNSSSQQQNSSQSSSSNTSNSTSANNSRLVQAQKQLDSLMNSSQFKTLYWMQFRFLQDAFRILVKTLNTATNNDFENTINTKMALFIVFVIAVVLAYLIFWTPFVSKLNRDIARTKMMLTIIPIQIILKIPKIQEFLNKQTTGTGTSSGASQPGANFPGGSRAASESHGKSSSSKPIAKSH